MKAKFKRTYKLLQAAENLKDLGNVRILAGWIKPEQKHGDMPTAQLAQIMEYGAQIKRKNATIVIPPRPMLRFAARDKSKEWVQEAGEIAASVIEGKTEGKKAYEKLGAFIADDIKGTINTSSLFKPNAPSTVKKKGKNTPLIDTGVMRDQVDYKVTKK